MTSIKQQKDKKKLRKSKFLFCLLDQILKKLMSLFKDFMK